MGITISTTTISTLWQYWTKHKPQLRIIKKCFFTINDTKLMLINLILVPTTYKRHLILSTQRPQQQHQRHVILSTTTTTTTTTTIVSVVTKCVEVSPARRWFHLEAESSDEAWLFSISLRRINCLIIIN